MATEKFSTYSGLPEEEKPKYKSLNEEGDFVERSSVEDPEVAHRLAHLENEAFGVLETSVSQRDISNTEIIERLGDKKLPYNERNRLQEMLFESADLARLKGNAIDSELAEVLKKSYTRLRYSKILREKVIEGISVGDTDAIGEILKDDKMAADFRLLGKLTNDEERGKAFAVCKERLDSSCSIIDKVEDIDQALAMYSEALKLVDPKSYSDTYVIESTGKQLANKLFDADATRRIVELVNTEIFSLPQCKDFLHRFGSEPEVIMELIINAKKVEDVYYALKFVTNPELLTQLAEDTTRLTSLTDEQRGSVAGYSKEIADAIAKEPEIITLSGFKEDKDPEFGDAKEPQNKFVVGIHRGQYVIAWSNMEESEYHRNIFEKIGFGLDVKSGGYIGIGESEGKKQIRMVRSSSDYGCYSRELLEHYRAAIEKSLKEVLGDEPFELVIKISSDYDNS